MSTWNGTMDGVKGGRREGGRRRSLTRWLPHLYPKRHRRQSSYLLCGRVGEKKEEKGEKKKALLVAFLLLCRIPSSYLFFIGGGRREDERKKEGKRTRYWIRFTLIVPRPRREERGGEKKERGRRGSQVPSRTLRYPAN